MALMSKRNDNYASFPITDHLYQSTGTQTPLQRGRGARLLHQVLCSPFVFNPPLLQLVMTAARADVMIRQPAGGGAEEGRRNPGDCARAQNTTGTAIARAWNCGLCRC